MATDIVYKGRGYGARSVEQGSGRSQGFIDENRYVSPPPLNSRGINLEIRLLWQYIILDVVISIPPISFLPSPLSNAFIPGLLTYFSADPPLKRVSQPILTSNTSLSAERVFILQNASLFTVLFSSRSLRISFPSPTLALVLAPVHLFHRSRFFYLLSL